MNSPNKSVNKYIVYAVLAVIVVVSISYMSSTNDVRKRKYPVVMVEKARKLVNDCAQNAITSSKINNPILAMTYVFKSAETVNTLRELMGDDDLFEITGIDMSDIEDMIRRHQRLVLDSVLVYMPAFISHDVWNSGLLPQLQQMEQPPESQEPAQEANDLNAEGDNDGDDDD